MVHVEGGELEIGDGTDRFSYYAPTYRARVASFWMDPHEVTVRDYRACIAASVCRSPRRAESLESCNTRHHDREDHPVNCINYPEAEGYGRYAGKRLPTEEEWERAARGSDGRTYPWGEDTAHKRVCWPGWNVGSLPTTCPVDMPVDDVSPYGVRGLAGNVSEWTSTPACPYYRRGCADSRGYRITRGGDFKTHQAKSYERLAFPAPSESGVEYGFRCVRDDSPG